MKFEMACLAVIFADLAFGEVGKVSHTVCESQSAYAIRWHWLVTVNSSLNLIMELNSIWVHTCETCNASTLSALKSFDAPHALSWVLLVILSYYWLSTEFYYRVLCLLSSLATLYWWVRTIKPKEHPREWHKIWIHSIALILIIVNSYFES